MLSDLKQYARKGYNVLLEGRRGGGKTAMTEEVFNEVFGQKGEDWVYFSASTMDPWVHLLGIPKIVKHERYGEVTRPVPPEAMLNENIKAIFIDEINRGPDELRSGLMELIHTRSINGRRLPNLQTVWAAMNPSDEDEGYDVEPMDPAQLDRFDCLIHVSCTPSLSFFRKKYGDDGEAAVTWWKSLPKKGQDDVSPRRLEKLVRGIRDEVNIKPMVSDAISVSGLEKSILGAKRKQALVSMLMDDRVPLEAKKQAVREQVVRAKANSPIELVDVAQILGDQVLFDMLEAMPKKEVAKNTDAVDFCVTREKNKGVAESRWMVGASGEGITAEGMRSIVLKKDTEKGLARNLATEDEASIERIALCYDATRGVVGSTSDPVEGLTRFKEALIKHRDALGTASAYQLGLAWALHIKNTSDKKVLTGTLVKNVMTHHFRKVDIHGQQPDLLYRWLVGMGIGNAWISLKNHKKWKAQVPASGLTKLGLKFLGNGDTRNVLGSLETQQQWADRHGASVDKLKIAMQIRHAKMASIEKAFLSDNVDMDEGEDDVAVSA